MNVEQFAWNMRKIPRRAIRCEIYDTIRIVVDKRHATNIIRKVIPTVTGPEIYDALVILQERLDSRPNF